MNLVVYNDVTSFLGANSAFLNATEAENNSFLGALGALTKASTLVEQGAYLAAVLGSKGYPLLAALSPPGGNLVLSAIRSEPVDAAISLVAEDLLARSFRPPGVSGEEQPVGQFARAWIALTRCSARPVMRQMLYVLHELNDVRRSPGKLRLAVESDLPLVAEWSHAFRLEALGRSDLAAAQQSARARIRAQEFYLWEDGGPVCMAGRARPTQHGIAINHVYTPPSERRKGYATSCVAELTSQLLASGYSFCTLYADVGNPESNAIYTRLGYKPLVESVVFEFEYGAQRLEAADA